MKTITVQVRDDHLEILSRTKPMTAMAELIWNALDAEATEIRVDFMENELGGLEGIRITDNGMGLSYEDAETVFRNLGGSWKRDGQRSPNKMRIMHGKYGKGRFRAFSLGLRVEWNTVYEDAGKFMTYGIQGKAESLDHFELTDTVEVSSENLQRTGMVVEIVNLPQNAGLLRGGKAQAEVTSIFALYMRQYPDVKLSYDGMPIDPVTVEKQHKEYILPELVMQDGERVHVKLEVVEWELAGKRGVYLCDGAGFMRFNALPRLHFRGFSYTAYLKSDYITTLDQQGLLETGDLSADVRTLLDAARAKLREHFTLREAENAQDTLADWKERGLYPYLGDPKDASEENERRIFDIYATHLNQIFPEFVESRQRSKRLTLRLIQELVQTQPTRMARILDELVDFPEEKEEEILELVQS